MNSDSGTTGLPIKIEEMYNEQPPKIAAVDVDTTFLFLSQFNTVPIPGISVSGMRVYQIDVEAVEDDDRLGRSRCGYCGYWANSGDPCTHCDKGTESMAPFFPGTKRDSNMAEEVQSIFDNIFK